jgi:hypothetical protein
MVFTRSQPINQRISVAEENCKNYINPTGYRMHFSLSPVILLSWIPVLYSQFVLVFKGERFLKCFSTRILIRSVTASTSDGYSITKGNSTELLFTFIYFIVVCRVFELHVGMVLAKCGIFREHLLWWHTYKTQLSLLLVASTFTGLLPHSHGHKQTVKFENKKVILNA